MTTTDPFLRALTGDADAQTVTLRRTLRGSRADVWDAVTSPARVARWFGPFVGEPPRGPGDPFSIDIGGGTVRRAVLETCDGPHGLAYTWWSGDDDPGHVRLTLRDVGDGRTELEVQHDRLRAHRVVGYGAGWEASLAVLAGLLDAEEPTVVDAAPRWELLGEHPLRVERVVTAAPAEVWAAWATGEAIGAWWWRHWDDVAIDADVRVGGAYRFASPSRGIGVAGEFLVVEPERRLAFTWVWDDDDATVLDEAVDVAFAPTPDGGTSIVVRHTGPWDTDAPAESYAQGWEFVLGQLAASVVR